MILNLTQSGAKINISDGSCPERIVTVTGNTESIFKAFTLICNKFEEVTKRKRKRKTKTKTKTKTKKAFTLICIKFEKVSNHPPTGIRS